MAVEAAVAKRLTNLDAASQVFVFVPPPPSDTQGNVAQRAVTHSVNEFA